MSKEIIQRIESLELTLKGWQENEPDTERSKRIQEEIKKELEYDYKLIGKHLE